MDGPVLVVESGKLGFAPSAVKGSDLGFGGGVGLDLGKLSSEWVEFKDRFLRGRGTGVFLALEVAPESAVVLHI